MDSLERAVARAVQGELDAGEGEAALRFQLNADFLGFQGHFPDHPVLPAFVQVLMGRHVLQQLQGEARKLLEVDRARFRLPIGPGELRVRCKQLDAGHLVQLETDQGQASSFLLFTEPAAAEGTA